MDFARRGDMILREFTGPEGMTNLVSLLLRIYRSYTPRQLSDLVSRPTPFALIHGIEATKARRLEEILHGQGVVLEFIPAPGPTDPRTREHPAAYQDTESDVYEKR